MMVNKAILNLFHAWLVAESISLSFSLSHCLSFYLYLSLFLPKWLSNHVSFLLFPSRYSRLNPPSVWSSKRPAFWRFIPGRRMLSFRSTAFDVQASWKNISDRRSTVYCDRLRGESTIHQFRNLGTRTTFDWSRAARRVASARENLFVRLRRSTAIYYW